MKKKLMRSRTDSKLAGVCGGLADYLNIDVVVIRALWVISAFFGGPSLGVYILCAIIIPKEPLRKEKEEPVPNLFDEDNYYEREEDLESDQYEEDEERKQISLGYLGLGLIGLGAFLGFKALFPSFDYRFLWPAILIVGGLLILSKNDKKEESE